MGRGTRATSACARCYKRKKKCSRGYPSCNECIRAGAPCVGLHRGTEAEVPRSVVSFLEDAVAQLELQRTQQVGSAIGHSSSPRDLNKPTEPTGPQIPCPKQNFEDLQSLAVRTAQDCSPLPTCVSSGKGFLPHSPTLFLGAELPFPLAFRTRRHFHWPTTEETPVSARLPQEVAAKLIRFYVEHILPGFPLFLKTEIQELYRRFERASDGSEDIEPGKRFTICMILATAVLSSQSQEYHKLVSLAEALRRDAFRQVQLDSFVAESTCAAIQKLLLIAYYGFLLPASANLWQVVGEASRIALELGLHQEPPDYSRMDTSTAEYRRRLFWILYSMERSIAITSHRPYAITGDQIGLSVPILSHSAIGSADDQRNSGSPRFLERLHLLRIQSEICSVNIGCRPIPNAELTYGHWLERTEERVLEVKDQATSTNGIESLACHAMLLLHMPCARNPEPTDGSLLKCFDTALKLTAVHWDRAQVRHVDGPWHAVHNCYEAGMLILYALWYHPGLIRNNYTTREVFDVVHQISGFFILISSQWPAAQQCGSLFDSLRKGALTAFCDECPLLPPSGLEARQLRDIVFRQNADSLYANDESTARAVAGEASLSLPDIDLSLGFLDDTAFLDLFNFSDASDSGAGLIGDSPTDHMPSANNQAMYFGTNVSTVHKRAELLVSQEEVKSTLETLPICSPCKKRRIRCDTLLPSCRNCTKLQKDCEYWDNVLSQQISRQHLHALHQHYESLVEDISSIQHSLGQIVTPVPQAAESAAGEHIGLSVDANLTSSLPMTEPMQPPPALLYGIKVSDSETSNIEYWGNTSAFARILHNASMLPRKVDLQSFHQPRDTLADELLQAATSCSAKELPYELARRLVLHYHNTIELFYPILGWSNLLDLLDLVHDGSLIHSHESVSYTILNLVLAVSCVSLRARDSQSRLLANVYFDNALANGVLGNLLTHPTAPALQISLLMCIFVWYCPGRINVWRLLGNATRICLDLVETVGSDKADSVMIGTLYRTTYSLETQIAVSFGRPRQLPESRDHLLAASPEAYPSVCELSKLVYELARLRNRLHRDLIGNGWVTKRSQSDWSAASDHSWINTTIFEIISWLEKWTASVESLHELIEVREQYASPNRLLSWGQLEQAETLLLAKSVSDSRRQALISTDDEVMAAQHLLQAADALQGGPFSLSGSSTEVSPMPWSKVFAIFDAGVVLIRNWASTTMAQIEIEGLFQWCVRLLTQCETSRPGTTISLSSSLRLLYDACIVSPNADREGFSSTQS